MRRARRHARDEAPVARFDAGPAVADGPWSVIGPRGRLWPVALVILLGLAGCGERESGRASELGRYIATTCNTVADPAGESRAFDELGRIREAGGIERSPFGPAKTVRVLRAASEEFSREGRAAAGVAAPPALASAHRDLVRGLNGQGSNWAAVADLLDGQRVPGLGPRTLYKRFVAARDAIGRWLGEVQRAARARDVALPDCFRGFRDGFESNPGAAVGG